ncbi:hypothetical protein GN244_ATG14633 [Phytophthora infestans]|uniref:Uncharacterized protein n=1 Tax=Phytophthora infestans TaxID=4787 RepID=A0A833SWZ5_PHYIN|nr:hypothetical protein GN244_ATG14633 [Phytophthora infestans]
METYVMAANILSYGSMAFGVTGDKVIGLKPKGHVGGCHELIAARYRHEHGHSTQTTVISATPSSDGCGDVQ